MPIYQNTHEEEEKLESLSHKSLDEQPLLFGSPSKKVTDCHTGMHFLNQGLDIKSHFNVDENV